MKKFCEKNAFFSWSRVLFAFSFDFSQKEEKIFAASFVVARKTLFARFSRRVSFFAARIRSLSRENRREILRFALLPFLQIAMRILDFSFLQFLAQKFVMEPFRFELKTGCLWDSCSNPLSYGSFGEGFRFFRKRFRFSLPSSLENEMGEGFGRFFALRENPFKREFENDMRASLAFALFFFSNLPQVLL